LAISVSIQLFHLSLSSTEIKGYFNMVPNIQASVNEQRVTSTGVYLDAKYDRTYLCYHIIDLKDNIIELERAIEITNSHFSSKVKNFDFLNSFIQTGGKIGYYIALYTRRYYVFELSPDILKQCEELHVNLGIEIFLDDTE